MQAFLDFSRLMEVKKNSFKAWLLAARPKTLTGAAVPVMIGLSLAYSDLSGSAFNVQAAILCFLFAFIMQIDANFINDLYDFLKGTDDRTTRLGPERACAQGWVSVGHMRLAIALTTMLACVVGLPLILWGGWPMVLVGIFCVVFCFLYTTHLSYLGLGDVLVLIFFGFVPVCITYYLQVHTFSFPVFAASLACGLVIDALLLVNNFRDRDTDRQAGKLTLVVRIGSEWSLMTYLAVGIAACVLGLFFVPQGRWVAFLLPILTYLPLHVVTYRRMCRIWEGRGLNDCLGETARNIFIYGLAVSIGLLFR